MSHSGGRSVDSSLHMRFCFSSRISCAICSKFWREFERRMNRSTEEAAGILKGSSWNRGMEFGGRV